jgi:pantoate kinase
MDWLVRWFKSSLLDLALRAAKLAGLSDARLERAIALVREAQHMPAENAQRREWAVAMLMQIGLKESLARLAVELAVAFVKWQQQA